MTSTSSSSSDLITGCAPVSWCGATCLGCGAGVLALAGVPLRGCDGCAGRVVGALTGSSLSPHGRCRGLKSEVGNKKPPPAQWLHEGCALVLESYPGVG